MSMCELFFRNIKPIKVKPCFSCFLGIFLLFYTGIYSQEKILQGGRFYIHHPEGLDLKREPEPMSESLQRIPYGGRIELEKEIPSLQSSQENVPGFWRKVLTKKGEEAFILDSFLSKYPTPSTNCENLKYYVDENYKKQKTNFKDEVHSRSILTQYSGNHRHILSKIGETRVHKLEIRNAKLKDGFFIGRACAHPAFRGHGFSSKGNTLEIEVEGGKHGEKHKLSIVEETNMTVITHTLIPVQEKKEEVKK